MKVFRHLSFHSRADELSHTRGLNIVSGHGCIEARLLMFATYALSGLENLGPLIGGESALTLGQEQVIVRSESENVH